MNKWTFRLSLQIIVDVEAPETLKPSPKYFFFLHEPDMCLNMYVYGAVVNLENSNIGWY